MVILIWRFGGFVLNRQIKSPPILFLDGTVEVSYGNPWPIRQTKCSPICVCCLIAKLNVRQMYHLYDISQ